MSDVYETFYLNFNNGFSNQMASRNLDSKSILPGILLIQELQQKHVIYIWLTWQEWEEHLLKIVCTPSLSARGGGELIPLPNFQKKGSLPGSQFLGVGTGKYEATLFRGSCSFYIKIKLKSEIFNDKKSLQTKMF